MIDYVSRTIGQPFLRWISNHFDPFIFDVSCWEHFDSFIFDVSCWEVRKCGPLDMIAPPGYIVFCNSKYWRPGRIYKPPW